MKVLFRRIGGRIIPIMSKVPGPAKDVAIAVGATLGVVTATTKIRKKTFGSTGSGFGDFLFDGAVSSIGVAALNKKFPAIGRGIRTIIRAGSI